MELTSPKNIKEILKQYQIKPLKKFGQNFLTDKNVLEKFIETAEVNSDDIVLEIGPGIGTITQELAKKTNQVIAIERDAKIAEILRKILKHHNYNNVEVIQENILKIGNSKLFKNLKLKALFCNYGTKQKKITKLSSRIGNYKIVANLPYYIASPVIRKFLESKNPPEKMILMVQKEVAQRICASSRKMSILSVSVQFYAKPEIISFVSKKSFWPQPKVDSAIIKITPCQSNNYSDAFCKQFFRVVRAGFSQPRKQLINNFLKKFALGPLNKLDKDKTKKWLLENSVNPEQRAETLSIENWINLTKTLPK